VLQEHEVKTAAEQDWSTLLNGELLRAADEAGFDVLITADQNLASQQNLRRVRLAIIALNSARWSRIEKQLGRIADAVKDAGPGSYTVIDIPH
jgi:hypothetical protein